MGSPEKTTPTLGESPDRAICFRCTRCGRHGRYGRDRLIAQFGAELPIVQLPIAVARWTRCHLALGQSGYQHDPPCGVHFDLAAMYLEERREEEKRRRWR